MAKNIQGPEFNQERGRQDTVTQVQEGKMTFLESMLGQRNQLEKNIAVTKERLDAINAIIKVHNENDTVRKAFEMLDKLAHIQ